MTDFAVEMGIPIPRRRGGNVLLYPWDEMKVGASFFVAHADESDRGRKAARVANAGNEWARRNDHDVRFEGRVVAGGVRVWRVK